MMIRGIRNFLAWCLFGLTASTALYAQSNSFKFAGLDPFPKVIVDTVQYSFELYLVNNDPLHNLEGTISVFISIDNDPATKLVLDITPSSPIGFGDSLEIPVTNYQFSASRFIGGGLTHDIIVWPMKVGAPPQDSSLIPVYFIDTSYPGATELALEVTDFPHHIREDHPYDLSFEIFNQDPEFLLYQPVSIYMNVDGGNQILLVDEVLPTLPVEPGHSFSVELPAHVFDAPSFLAVGGGGVTHDIIVWPMKIGNPQVDSAHLEVEYFDRAAFSMSTGVIGLPPVLHPFIEYDIIVAAENIGAIPNTQPIDFFIQLDNQTPQLYYQSSLLVGVGNIAGTSYMPFEVGSYFGFSPADSAFGAVSHTIRFWAVEQSACQWYEAVSFPVAAINSIDPFDTESIMNSGGLGNSDSSNTGRVKSYNLIDSEYQPYQQQFNLKLASGMQPNPFQNQLKIRSEKPSRYPVNVQLFTPSYVPVLQKRWEAGVATDMLQINTAHLRPGLYLYRLEIDGILYMGKIVKE